MKLGGYEQQMTTFTPVDDDMKPFDVLVFVATENSRHWLGEAPEEDIAKQVSLYTKYIYSSVLVDLISVSLHPPSVIESVTSL